jgi:AcrR family transcriptional regulator
MARRIGSNGAETAETLRRTALRLFAREGYAAVSMRRIAAEVGVQAGALYNHVRTKQDLLSDLLVEHMENLLAAWEAQDAALSDPAAALDQFTRFHIRYHLGREDEVFIAYMELRNLDPENFARIEALRQRYERILQEILAAGDRAGVFVASDPPVAARAIISMLTGVTTWFREGGRLSAAEIEDIYTQMVAQSVGRDRRQPCSTHP